VAKEIKAENGHGGVRIVRGDETGQVSHDGRPADPEKYYYEPLDYDGDMLWSTAYDSEAAALAASGATTA
jgi:hypothetical protein